MATNNKPVKKVAKKAAKKVAKKAIKKTATKKVVKKTVKKPTPKKVVKKSVKSATGNTELDAMLATIKEATRKGEKKIVVFTTAKEHHKDNVGSGGFGVTDLKPKFLEAYKHLLCKFNLSTNLVNPNELAVEWIVKF
jgi:aspartyl-tRNA synthetase